MVKVNYPLPPPNQPPVVFAGADTSVALPVNTITFTGNAADADGSIIKYEWKQISGPASSVITSPNLPVTAVHNLAEGIYYFSLTAWDNKYQPTRDVVKLTVNAVNSTGNTSVTDAGDRDKSDIAADISKTIYTAAEFLMGPNPVKEIFNVGFSNSETGKVNIRITDFQGRMIKTYAFEKSFLLFRQQLQLGELAAGMHMAEVLLNGKRITVCKFYKR